MIPLFIPERRKAFPTKVFLALSGLIILVMSLGSWYFFEKRVNRSVPSPPEEVAPSSSLADWVDEQPVLDDEGDSTPSGEGEKEYPVLPPPAPPVMEKMKTKGCVADGFLSGYGGDINSSIAMINRSECYYLHRALETWLKPPDFKLARKIQSKVTKPNTVYGMFLAEAIDTKANFFYPDEQRDFDFDRMCRNGSKNYWGEHTCKPSLDREEYRKYIKFITDEAMNIGIQSFLFGEVFYQDNTDMDKTFMPEVIRGMREHAEYLGLKIVIGAQTNDIADAAYLQLFDFIEGGVGLGSDGSIEDGPCFSRWWQKPGDWCWALLWHPEFKDRAKNVFVHFDWSGKLGDDMSVFTRMGERTRRATLTRLHAYFTSRDVGFLMPMLATLYRDNDGCSGPKKRFYSASKKYSCQDEESINSILGLGK